MTKCSTKFLNYKFYNSLLFICENYESLYKVSILRTWCSLVQFTINWRLLNILEKEETLEATNSLPYDPKDLINSKGIECSPPP